MAIRVEAARLVLRESRVAAATWVVARQIREVRMIGFIAGKRLRHSARHASCSSATCSANAAPEVSRYSANKRKQIFFVRPDSFPIC